MASNSPVTPDNIKSVIASPTSSVCANMISTLLKLPMLLYQFFAWALNSDGTASDNLIAQIFPTGSLRFSAAPLTTNVSWILADGSAVSRTTYANLFAVIGTIYGAGDGSTTFNLPDFRNNFPVGAANSLPPTRNANQSQTPYSLGQMGGEAFHFLTIPELPAFPTYNPYVNDPASSDPGGTPDVQGSGVPLSAAQLFPSLDVIGGDGTVATPTPANTNPLPPLSPATKHNTTPEFLAVWIYIKT